MKRNKHIGTPEQFMQKVQNKIAALGGSYADEGIESAQTITAGVTMSRDLQEIYNQLARKVGSKMMLQPAILVSFGDGSYGFISEDELNGEEFYINICSGNADMVCETGDEVIEEVVKTWREGESEEVESSKKSCKESDTIEATDEIDDTPYSEDLVKEPVEGAESDYDMDVEEYADKLGELVVDRLFSVGYSDAEHTIVDEYLEISIDSIGYRYIQYLDEITPAAEDLEDDADTLFEGIAEEIENTEEG